MDLSSFYGKSLPLGATLTRTYVGDLVTDADGSVWIAGTTTAPFAYTSVYSGAPAPNLIAHPIMPGPKSSYWWIQAILGPSLAYKSASTLYCTGGTAISLEGDSTNGFYYYTSSNVGVNWTQRTFPNNKAYQVSYTAGLFVGVSLSSTTNAIITSTDAVTWTSLTGISQTTVADIVSNGSTSIVAFPQSGTVANVSVDSGATWASAAITAPAAPTQFSSGMCTWNAGAGLFIGNNGSAGGYQTSPTGATWTNRPTQSTFGPYGLYFTALGLKFCSNSTTTVAVGLGGFFATTTDGLTWANHGFILAGMTQLAPTAVYHDGTRFVAIFTDRVFYSTNGAAWVAGRNINPAGGGGVTFVAGDRFFRACINNAFGVGFIVTDVTATAPLTVCPTATAQAQNNAITYYRIK